MRGRVGWDSLRYVPELVESRTIRVLLDDSALKITDYQEIREKIKVQEERWQQ